MITFLNLIFVSTLSLLSTLAISQTTANDPFICPPCGDGSCDNTLYQEAGVCPACGMALGYLY